MLSPTTESVADFLLKCPASELIKALTPRLNASWVEKNGLRSGLVLCEFSRLTAPAPGANDKWEFELIGKPTDEIIWSSSEVQDFWEQGDCHQCGYSIASYAKEAVCPLCGERVELT